MRFYSVFYGFMMTLGSGKVMVIVAALKIRPEIGIWEVNRVNAPDIWP